MMKGFYRNSGLRTGNMMAQMLGATTDQEEMKNLADQIITSQSWEIDTMRSWDAT